MMIVFSLVFMKPCIAFADFEKIDIRIGTIIEVLPFENAKKPAYILHIDFGECGIKKSSAQITKNYTPDILLGKKIMAVVNFPPKQIANFFSEVLVLGAVGENNDVFLPIFREKVFNGMPIR